MPLVLHAGLQKTATTYIQRYLSAHRDELRAHGVTVPRFFNEYSPGHHNFVSALRDEPCQHQRRRSFRAMSAERRLELARSRPESTLLLSTERLFRIRGTAVTRLHDLLAEQDAVIVAFMRRRSDLVYSKWRSESKRFVMPRLDHYVDQLLSARFSPLGVLGDVNKFENRVKAGVTRLVHYDGLVAAGVDPVAGLFTAAGIVAPAPITKEARGPRANVGAPPVEAELMRLIWVRAEMLDRTVPIEMLQLAFDHQRSIDAGPIEEAIAHVAPRVTATMNLRHVDAHYVEEDRRILARYGDRITGLVDGPLHDIDGHEYPELELFDTDVEADRTLAGLVDRLTDALIQTWTTRPQRRPSVVADPPPASGRHRRTWRAGRR